MFVGINVLAAFVVRDPETMGLRPDGSDVNEKTQPQAADDTVGRFGRPSAPLCFGAWRV